MRHTLTISGVLLSVLLVAATAAAQDGNVAAEPLPPPEQPAPAPTPVYDASEAPREPAPAAAPAAEPATSSAVQLAFQGRLDAMGYFAPNVDTGGRGVDLLGFIQTITPYVTPGVRLLEGRLFVGLGIGFGGFSSKQCQDTCDDYDVDSQSYFALSPLATFDILRAGAASFYAGGWFSFVPISSASRLTHRIGTPDVTTEVNSGTAIGVNLAVGLRGQLVQGLSIGTEWGWGLTSLSSDGTETGPRDDTTTTLHGIFGTVMIEGAIDL